MNASAALTSHEETDRAIKAIQRLGTSVTEVTLTEAEWQRLKRCEHHLKAILRAVRINAVAEEIETARFWYRKTGSLVLP